MTPTATSRLLALIGDPVAHSLSPVMYNAAIRTLGLDAVYVAVRADANALPHVIRAFEATGIAGNVTVPHKVAVARLLIRLTSVAKEIEAVNTFWPEGGRLVGDNTDVRGLMDALEPLQPEGPWLVLGTGGASRAVALAAREMGLSILVRSREVDRARSFVQWAQQINVAASVDDGTPVGTIINATPLGLRSDDPPPVDEQRMQGCQVGLDLVYARGGTRWVKRCRERGLRASDGRSMLVAQGAHAFARFYPGQPPKEVMAAAVERALAT